MKKHTRDKTVTHQWAKRYFTVDDVRGTISYSKGVTKKATVCLPLVDIATVEEVEEHCSSYSGFLVSCPPVHLTLCAEDKEDRQLWVTGLRRRAKLWQDKVAANGIAVASRADGPRAAEVSGPVAYAAVVSSPRVQHAQLGSGSADVEADAAEERSPEEQEVKKKKKKKKKKPVDEGAPADGAAEAPEAPEAGAAEEEKRPVKEAAASPAKEAPRAVPVSPGSRTVAPAGAGALRRSSSSLHSPILRGHSRKVMMAPDEEEAPHMGEARGYSFDSVSSAAERSERTPPPGANPSAIQTIEVMSDSDSDEPERGGLRRAAPRDNSESSLKPKGNLEDMLSSDEEEDDGYAIPQHVPMPARALPELEPPPSVFNAPRSEEPEEAAPRQQRASPPRKDVGGSRPWGGPQSGPGGAAANGADAAVGEAWDSDEEEGTPARRQSASPPHRSPVAVAPSAGAGIPADRNFVDDDWDEDENE